MPSTPPEDEGVVVLTLDEARTLTGALRHVVAEARRTPPSATMAHEWADAVEPLLDRLTETVRDA